MSKRLLMLCYHFPPIRAVAVVRSVGFARNLPAFGWDPTVLTVAVPRNAWVGTGERVPDDVRVVRSYEWNLDGLVELSHGAIDHMLRLVGIDLRKNYLRDAICIPDSHVAWFSTAPALRLCRQSDAIYVSCSPFSSALSGCLVKTLGKRPLVVDFRDAWSLNPHVHHLPHHRAAVKALERRVLRCCDKLVVNTAGAERLYRDRYPQWSGKIVAIPNGYDSFSTCPGARAAAPGFRVMHVGSFYGSRSPRRLLEAIARLRLLDAEFVQVGAAFPEMKQFASRVRIRQIPTVPHAEALSLMRGASVLYLRQGEEPGMSYDIAVGAKTYDYLATGLPILAECPPGDNADLVREYGRGSEVVTNGSSWSVARALARLYRRRDTVVPAVDPRFVERFDRRNLTRQLADVLNSIVDRAGWSDDASDNDRLAVRGPG